MDDQTLRAYFEFDEADLAANRQGQLTAKQRRYFAEDVKDTWLAGLIMGAVIFLLPTAIALVFAVKIILGWQQTHSASALGALLPLGVVIVIFAALGGLTALWSYRQSRSVASYTLKQATGPANLVAVERRSDSHHAAYLVNVLHIGPLAVDIKQALAGELLQGTVMTAYYFESKDGSRQQVLSVELGPGR